MDLSLTPLKLEDSTCSAKVISQIFFPYAPPKFWRLEKGQCWDGKFHQMLVSGGWSQNPWCEMNGIRLLMIHHPLQLWRLDTDSSRTLWKRALKDCWQVLTNLQCHHHHIEDVKLASEFKRQVNLKLLELSEVYTWPSACWDVPMFGDICRTGVSCQCKLMWPCFSLLHLPLNGIQYLGLFVIYSTLFDWSSLCCDISVQCGDSMCVSFDILHVRLYQIPIFCIDGSIDFHGCSDEEDPWWSDDPWKQQSTFLPRQAPWFSGLSAGSMDGRFGLVEGAARGIGEDDFWIRWRWFFGFVYYTYVFICSTFVFVAVCSISKRNPNQCQSQWKWW